MLALMTGRGLPEVDSVRHDQGGNGDGGRDLAEDHLACTNRSHGGEDAPAVLTSIPAGIHCTPAHGIDVDENEVDVIMVEAFLTTLAGVALAIASRKAGPGTP